MTAEYWVLINIPFMMYFVLAFIQSARKKSLTEKLMFISQTSWGTPLFSTGNETFKNGNEHLKG